MRKELEVLRQAIEIAEQAWNKWREVNKMAALQELELLLNRATLSALEAEVVRGGTVPVAKIGEGIDLVYGVFSYPSRGIGVPERPLTYKLTRQPVLAVKNGDEYSPLAYAEDVETHPLCEVLVGHLEALSSRLP